MGGGRCEACCCGWLVQYSSIHIPDGVDVCGYGSTAPGRRRQGSGGTPDAAVNEWNGLYHMSRENVGFMLLQVN